MVPQQAAACPIDSAGISLNATTIILGPKWSETKKCNLPDDAVGRFCIYAAFYARSLFGATPLAHYNVQAKLGEEAIRLRQRVVKASRA